MALVGGAAAGRHIADRHAAVETANLAVNRFGNAKLRVVVEVVAELEGFVRFAVRRGVMAAFAGR